MTRAPLPPPATLTPPSAGGTRPGVSQRARWTRPPASPLRQPAVEAALGAGVAGRAVRAHPHQQGVAVAVDQHAHHLQRVARGLPLAPEVAAAAAPEPALAAAQRPPQRLAGHV